MRRVEGLLLQAHRKLKEGNQTEAASLLDEAHTLLPLKLRIPVRTKEISNSLDLCQVMQNARTEHTNTTQAYERTVENEHFQLVVKMNERDFKSQQSSRCAGLHKFTHTGTQTQRDKHRKPNTRLFNL